MWEDEKKNRINRRVAGKSILLGDIQHQKVIIFMIILNNKTLHWNIRKKNLNTTSFNLFLFFALIRSTSRLKFVIVPWDCKNSLDVAFISFRISPETQNLGPQCLTISSSSASTATTTAWWGDSCEKEEKEEKSFFIWRYAYSYWWIIYFFTVLFCLNFKMVKKQSTDGIVPANVVM